MEQPTTLDEGQDVVEAAQRSRPTRFRDREIEAALNALQANRSVLLIGPPGVGKSAVLLGVAQRLAQGFDPTLTGIRRFTTTQIMSGTRYLGEWKSKLTRLMDDAAQSATVLNIVDVWNLPTVGTTSQSKANLLDAMRPRLADGRLRLISEATADQLQEMHRLAKFVSLFEVVRIEPLSAQEMRAIVQQEAADIGLAIGTEAQERLFELCQTFHAANAGPGTALDLLHKLRDYRDQKLAVGEATDITPLFVEKVFAIHSGLPLFVVSKSESKSASQIRDWFRERIVGQENAIEAVVEMIAFYKARLHDTGKPVGSFLFVGPTGVGKTELARTLAEFFFGSDRRLLRFDMSEFSDFHSFEMLVGTQVAPERPARLIDPVRVQPFQVLLFDELEKAHRNIQDLFLQLLDEGRLTTPRGETVSFRNTIIIATSNVGAFEGMTTGIGFGDKGERYDADKALAAVEAHFRPEFLNRFQHVVLFHPLTREQAARIARADLQATLKREGITGRNLIVDVHDELIDHVLAVGFNPRYGGRGIKREIRRQVILPIATLLMERTLEPGSLIDVGLHEGRVRARVADPPDSRRAKAEKAPVRTRSGDRLTREAARQRAHAARAACEALGCAAEIDRLRDEVEEIDRTRRDHGFWSDLSEAAGTLAQQTRALEAVTRIERLQETAQELVATFDTALTRAQLAHFSDRLVELEAAIAVARREIVTMGADGHADALVEIAPVGTQPHARDFLFKLYRDWARERGLEVVMLREPMTAAEPVALALHGAFAHGYLKGEAGLHRLRKDEKSAVARVAVAPWSNRAGAVEFGEQRALKAVGQLGGKIRSRVSVPAARLVLQNSRTLDENRELARDVAPNWPREQPPTPPRVRLYDVSQFLVRDYLTKADFTRKDILSPKSFHELLCARLDRAAQAGEARADGE
jgi:ATP-dependent Clp protease ATP-binding subunit ClpC